MANDFSKEERVAFENELEKFNDMELMAKVVNKYKVDDKMAERANDTIWRTMPYIMDSDDGEDQSANPNAFGAKTQLAVPAQINIEKVVSWSMTGLELRDALQEERLKSGGVEKLGSDVNKSLVDVACNQGSLVVDIATAAGEYADIAECDSIMTEQGIMSNDRYIGLHPRDYNGMASNLADRQTLTNKALAAYERNYIGNVAGFDAYKLEYTKRIGAAAGGVATVDTTAAGTFYTPKGTDTNAINGGQSNVDNRFDTIAMAGAGVASIAAGDCFTIAGIESVHHITKEPTGQLKTFRVIASDGAGNITITPPLVDPDEGAGANSEKQYQNVDATSTSATAAVTWLNIAAANLNPFWYKDSIEILPGRYVDDPSAGVSVLKGQTDSGLELCLTKQFGIGPRSYKYRFDVRYGVVNTNPQMNGVLLFGQT